MPKINFKFHKHATPASRNAVLSELKSHGATAVRPLFPEALDQELATMYIAETADDASSQLLIKHLNGSKAIDFAEPQARRKLVR
jgi:hypothetical protein